MLFSAVLLNFILGTIIYIIWKLLGRLAESKGYVEINYWIWKIVLLAFLCPVGIIVLFGIKKKGLYGFDFWYANKIRILLTVLGIVWFIGSVIRAFIYMKKMHQMHKMLQKGRKCQPEIIKKKQQICCELGQKNNIDIVKHKEIKIPMAYGIFHRRIVLPEIEYSEEEIDIILHHELIHHKHHDLLWKAIFMMVHITYWFHPGMKDLIRQLDQWGEAYCDRTASYYIESMKTYFNVIIDIATEEKECNTYCMGLCENSELLVLRMKRMLQRWHEWQGLTLANAMIGAGTDYASLKIVDELNAEEYGVAFRKGSDAAAAVDAAFDELKADGTMQALADKYDLALAE